jgi:hypothetical protein
LPAGSGAWGASITTWQERYYSWILGSSTNPLPKNICGERIRGVFYLNTTSETGTKEVNCRLRQRTPLLASVAGAVDFDKPDQELLASIRAEPKLSRWHVRAVLDGSSLAGAVNRSLRFTPVYDVQLEPGNLAAQLHPSLKGERSTRAASGGWLLRMRPLPVGHHILVCSARIPGLGFFRIRFHINVV